MVLVTLMHQECWEAQSLLIFIQIFVTFFESNFHSFIVQSSPLLLRRHMCGDVWNGKQRSHVVFLPSF